MYTLSTQLAYNYVIFFIYFIFAQPYFKLPFTKQVEFEELWNYF